MNQINRPLIIYHGNCADGFSAAWCFWKLYGGHADYIAGVYQQPPPDVRGRDVYLVDFSYKAPVVADMLRVAASVTLIDHHKSALEDLEHLRGQWSDQDYPQLKWFCDLDRSGATLAWDYCFPHEPRPLLLDHIEDRDLWRFKLQNTREIQACVFSHEYKFETWDQLMFSRAHEHLSMIAQGAAIERKHHKDIKELVAVCKRQMVIGDYTVPCASLPYTLTSDAGHLMAEDQPFAACYWDTADGRNFSLRSRDDGIDVSEIAKQYGGGGHKHAAGFKVPRDHALATA